MNKFYLGGIALVITLVMIVGVMGANEEATGTATVTVNEFVDITLGGAVAITFGSLDPGTSDNAATGGAVTITIEPTTNIVTDTFLRGDDWSSPTTLAINNVKYGDNSALNATMSTAYAAANNGYFEDVACPCGGSAVVKNVYHWLNVPSGQQAGSYIATNIYFKTVSNGATP